MGRLRTRRHRGTERSLRPISDTMCDELSAFPESSAVRSDTNRDLIFLPIDVVLRESRHRTQLVGSSDGRFELTSATTSNGHEFSRDGLSRFSLRQRLEHAH